MHPGVSATTRLPRGVFCPAVLLLVSTMLACAEDARTGGDTYVMQDSAGIRVIENRAPIWERGEEWRVESEPVLDIGQEEGPPEVAFGNAHSPVRLSDGRIVVADMQTNRMYFYDAQGTYLQSAGGSGEGPGEFEQLYRLRKISGDSLMALNPPTLTSIFSPEGEFVRQFSLEPVPQRGNIWWTGYLEGGTLLALSLQREGTREREVPVNAAPGVEHPRFEIPEQHEFYRDTLLHFLYTMEGQLIDSIGKWPGQYLSSNRTFAPHAAYAYRDNVIYHSPGDALEIRAWRVLARVMDGSVSDTAGSQTDTVAGGGDRASGDLVRLERIIRAEPPRDLAVTESDREIFFAQERERMRQMAERFPQLDAAAMERRMLEQRFPDRIPAHGNRMQVDAEGNIWLQQYDVESSPDRPTRWSVFDPEGRLLGVVETPARFIVNDIGADYVLGIWVDELDVQHVRMYRLSKPAAS